MAARALKLVLCLALGALCCLHGADAASKKKFTCNAKKRVVEGLQVGPVLFGLTSAKCKAACSKSAECYVYEYDSAGAKTCRLYGNGGTQLGQSASATTCVLALPNDGFVCTKGKKVEGLSNDELIGYMYHQMQDGLSIAKQDKECRGYCEAYANPCLGYAIDTKRYCYTFKFPLKFSGSDSSKTRLCSRVKCSNNVKLAWPLNEDEAGGYLQHRYDKNDDFDLLDNCRQWCLQRNKAGGGASCVSYVLTKDLGCYLFPNALQVSGNPNLQTQFNVRTACIAQFPPRVY